MTTTTRLAVTRPTPSAGRSALHEERMARVRAARGARPACSSGVRRRLSAEAEAEAEAEPALEVAPPAARVRITRRGRLLLLLVLAALLFTAFSLGRSASEAASEPAEAVRLEQTTVQPGDTLWAVARRIAPDHDPREVVDQIRRLNDLSSAELTAGQQLMLPSSR